MSASASPAIPAFSYAQAAKGLTTVATQSGTKEESNSPVDQSHKETISPDRDTSPTASKSGTSKVELEEKGNVELAQSRATPRVTSTTEQSHRENDPPSQRSRASSEKGQASPSAVVVSEPQQTLDSGYTAARSDSISLPANRQPDMWEKGSQTSTEGQSLQIGEKEKPKDLEDDWEKVSVPSVSAEKELKAAPIPAVNIWQQRREAQQAKQKEFAPQKSSSLGSPASAPKLKSSSEDSRRKSGGRDTAVVEKEAPTSTRKMAEISKTNDRKEPSSTNHSRTMSRNLEKGGKPGLPPVVDTKSWPTPETALHDDRRRYSTQEKSEKQDSKSNGQKSHAKWVQIPFVPTAKFETQLPPAAARRGGRTNTRTRDNSGRGNQATQANNFGDRPDGSGSMAPPPNPRQGGEQDRGRRSDGNRGARSSSLPSGSRRPTSSESSTPNFRRFPGSNSKTQNNTEDHKNASDPREADAVPTAAPVPGTDMVSRSSSRHDGPKPTSQATVNGSFQQMQSDDTQNSNATPVSEATIRPVYSMERKAPHLNNIRSSGDNPREKGGPRNFDWSREKSDNSREKADSWRDREASAEQSNRREIRSERGRGSYRGRGGHSYGAPYTPSHAYTSPLPQNGFEVSRPNALHEPKSRQSSQPFPGPPPTSTNTRNNPRSQSIPTGMMYQQFYNSPIGGPQSVSPLQTEMPMYGYQSPMQLQPGIMSSMPYNDALNSFALLSMIITQLEYYFSIDNLCKDLFLRKNMDSQGYVPLSVIANFKRIKTLTEDATSIDILRYASQQAKSVEYFSADNGEDRIRRRDGWRDFVLPLEERLPAARNDGLPVSPRQSRQDQSTEQVHTDVTFLSGQMRSPSGNVVGLGGSLASATPVPYSSPFFNGQASEPTPNSSAPTTIQDQFGREAATSPYAREVSGIRSPFSNVNPGSISNMSNGHHRHLSKTENEENMFPDESIPAINVCVREPVNSGVAGQVQILGDASKPASTDSDQISIPTSEMPPNTLSSRVSGLRGGAASPADLDHPGGMSFGNSLSQQLSNDEPVVFFTRDGQQTLPPPPQPGQYYQTYQSLHDIAIKQRGQGIEGALEPLYAFWSNFLVDKFNVGMYEEFKHMAQSDMNEGNDHGNEYLMRYYDKLLKAPLPMTDRIATDLVRFLREEKTDNRAVFQILKAAWRNGATNLKTRKRLGDILTAHEKTAFDKGG